MVLRYRDSQARRVGSRKKRTVLCNTFTAVDSDWTQVTTGVAYLANDKYSKSFVFKIPSLDVGEKIKSFRIVGSIAGSASYVGTVDAILKYVAKGTSALGVTIGSIDTTTADSAIALDSEEVLSTEVEVVSDRQYFILVTGSTDPNSASKLYIAGAEVDVN